MPPLPVPDENPVLDEGKIMNDPYTHYNARYDNTVYHQVQIAVLRDIHGDSPKASEDNLLAGEPTNTIMNSVINAALAVSGVEHCQNAMRSLILLVLQHSLSDETVHIIANHLCLFERRGDNRADDFVATITAVRQASKAEPALHEAIRSASEIHNKEGRCAYHLLTAAHALTQSAVILLKEGQGGYLDEKLARGVKHLEIAQQEMSL